MARVKFGGEFPAQIPADLDLHRLTGNPGSGSLPAYASTKSAVCWGELQSGAMNRLSYGDNPDVLRRHDDPRRLHRDHRARRFGGRESKRGSCFAIHALDGWP
jgi:hypothetical protein